MRLALSLLCAIGPGLPAGLCAQDVPSVAGEAQILVRGALPRCHPRAGDPLDEVSGGGAPFIQSVLAPDASGTWRIRADDDPILAPDSWQRAGKGIADFRFRVPTDDKPLCIGSRVPAPRGWGQLRRVVDAAPLRGRYARFTAFVATRRSSEVRFWLAVGNRKGVIQGGDTSAQPVRGTHKWLPVQLTIGPIPKDGIKLSYGFLLKGAGDIWILHPRLEILDRADSQPRTPNLSRNPAP